ncbi:MAG: MFS transporter [Chroococcidiopsidaceae cyanobacterium CP_BM_ER_R8_30]|nr:MFS transporter [Chroococcidiopsidaceae cyanobacterium CP_BM_ER_R8_30]
MFAGASVWCGLSTSVNQLIVARAVQGIGGALLVPGSLAIISASFSGEQRGQAIVDGFRFVMFVTVGLTLLSAFVALVMIRDKPRHVTNNIANAEWTRDERRW